MPSCDLHFRIALLSDINSGSSCRCQKGSFFNNFQIWFWVYFCKRTIYQIDFRFLHSYKFTANSHNGTFLFIRSEHFGLRSGSWKTVFSPSFEFVVPTDQLFCNIICRSRWIFDLIRDSIFFLYILKNELAFNLWICALFNLSLPLLEPGFCSFLGTIRWYASSERHGTSDKY